MHFSDLQKITKGTVSITKDIEVRRFSTNTRTLSGSTDEVFIAVQGKRDGHDYVQRAIDKGIHNFIVERAITAPDCNVLTVDNSLEAFRQIARHHRLQFSIPIVGITGSNGKTTVKEWLSVLLSEQFFVVKNPKSFNSQVGVPMSVMELRSHHEVAVFEAGISTTGEMERLANIIQPTLGIFTTLGRAHDDGFASKEEKLQEKLKLFSNAKSLICRSDVPYFHQLNEESDITLVTWALDDSGKKKVAWSEGTITVDGVDFQTDLFSSTDLENITHSIIGAQFLGVNNEAIQKGLYLIRPVSMRLELKRGINGSYLLDDSYNNDFIGLKVALDYLESHQQNNKRTLILSDILQAGKPDEELYKEVYVLLEKKNVNRLIGVGPRISAQRHLFNDRSEFFESTDALLDHLPAFDQEMIVIKGARDFALERIVKALEERSHGTVLEVNFESLQFNLNQYRDLLAPQTKLMVMVKANAYGSGLLEVANFLQHQRVDQLGVAYVDEAIQLRKNGITIPIMIMNPHIESFADFERYDLQAEIFSIGHLKRMLKDTVNPPAIHLKVDTGMHRLGFAPDKIDEVLSLIKQHPNLKVAGVFTHFSSSDAADEDDFTREQAAIFEKVYQQITEALWYEPIRHACNSPAMVRWPQYHYDMVRLGIGLHGFDPSNQLKLRRTSRLRTVISQVQYLKKGDTVGYSRKGLLYRDSKIAILPIGYEDGYLRVFGNGNAHVLVNGAACPTVGNICMDMTMIDVTDIDVKEGDEAVLFGESPSIQELATWADTIPYEILTNVSSRVKRVFVSE